LSAISGQGYIVALVLGVCPLSGWDVERRCQNRRIAFRWRVSRQLECRGGSNQSKERNLKGDWVEIVVDAGGEPRTYEVSATRAGRRVEVSLVRNVVAVSEVTRGGSVVRTARFMANRVLALVEHPAARSLMPDDLNPAGGS
jgi:hypothetical protein